MKIGFVSLGCPKNQLDTEVMLNELRNAGYEITPEETEADIIVINTCAFIEAAKRESIDNILDVAWLKTNHTLKGIIVTGCMTERYREEVLKEFPEVDAILGIGSIHDIVEAVQSVERGERGYTSFRPKDEVELGGDRVLTTPTFWTYLKIAEGCDNRCTYCAIPYIRGKYRSRPIEELVSEARELESLGAREINIIAQDITRYGADLYGEYSLARLLRELTAATKSVFFRLLYCYPDKITDELVAEIRDNPRVLKYIDIPLQHISDNVLRRMNRHGDSAMIREVIAHLRREVPGIVIRTTFITGFPGETEEDFEQLCDFVNETRFDRLGVFPYSQEEGTPAAEFPDQIDEQLKQDRADIIMRDQLAISEELNRARVGTTLRVLCEDFDPVSELHFGRSYADAPEIDGKVYFRAPRRIAPGSLVDVKITEVLDYDLCGSVVTK
ncbi:MAG TPA: 30S ribosomal protein S12 methylthiotransferase RimO [Clostridiales bacterium]|nr:30S ribosomal protein S12 methylthiotransferase RimO [Clostridiales bacterium]